MGLKSIKMLSKSLFIIDERFRHIYTSVELKCEAGQYIDFRSSEMTTCTRCGTNTVSKSGATECTVCEAGTVSNEDNTECG